MDLNVFLGDGPKDIDALSRRARVFYFLKRFEEAYADADRVINLRPKKCDVALNVRGLIRMERKGYDLAIDFFTRALDNDPTLSKALYIGLRVTR